MLVAIAIDKAGVVRRARGARRHVAAAAIVATVTGHSTSRAARRQNQTQRESDPHRAADNYRQNKTSIVKTLRTMRIAPHNRW